MPHINRLRIPQKIVHHIESGSGQIEGIEFDNASKRKKKQCGQIYIKTAGKAGENAVDKLL